MGELQGAISCTEHRDPREMYGNILFAGVSGACGIFWLGDMRVIYQLMKYLGVCHI